MGYQTKDFGRCQHIVQKSTLKNDLRVYLTLNSCFDFNVFFPGNKIFQIWDVHSLNLSINCVNTEINATGSS